jgi:hypothetical protein
MSDARSAKCLAVDLGRTLYIVVHMCVYISYIYMLLYDTIVLLRVCLELRLNRFVDLYVPITVVRSRHVML